MSPANNNAARWGTITIALVAIGAAAFFVLRKPQEDSTESAPAQANAGGIVLFRMEQQWLIRLRMAMAEEAGMAPQIHSTGRIVPAPSNRAIVAPPVGGLIQRGR